MRAYWQCAVDVNWTLVAMWWKLPRTYRSFAVFSLTSVVTGRLRVSASFNFVARCTHLLWNSSRCHAACQTVGGWWHGSVPIVSRAGGSAHSHVSLKRHWCDGTINPTIPYHWCKKLVLLWDTYLQHSNWFCTNTHCTLHSRCVVWRDSEQCWHKSMAGWPLVWKCQGIWQLSGILLKIAEMSEKSCKGKLKLFIVSCTVASIQVFSTSTDIWVTLNMPICREHCQGISIVWRAVVLYLDYVKITIAYSCAQYHSSLFYSQIVNIVTATAGFSCHCHLLCSVHVLAWS